MISVRLLFAVIAVSANAAPVLGFSSGAPESVCNSLVPRHGVDAQRTSAPFRLLVLPIDGLRALNVTIIADRLPFRGFIIQARSSSDPDLLIDGDFSVNHLSQTINCKNGNGNTLTHSDPQAKFSLSTLWKPQSSVKNVHFKATVVHTKEEFWTDIFSDDVTLAESQKFEDKQKQKDEGTLDSVYDGCDKTKNCFGLLQNCVNSKSCNLLLTATFKNDIVEFEMFGKVSVAKWFAMALSNDENMASDSVTECIYNGNQPLLKESWNGDFPQNDYVSDSERVVTTISTSFDRGFVTCKWHRPLKTTVRGFQFDLSTSHILLAYGEIQNGIKRKHSKRLASSQAINLLTINLSSLIGDSSVHPLVKLHGSLMVTAWFGMVSVAILLARHYKNVWEGQDLFGKPVWFTFHRGLMLASVTLAAISMISIFIHLKGWRASSVHPYVGVVANVFMFFQPLGALFRCHPNTPNRWIFNWGHWLGGNIAHIAAITAVFFTVNLQAVSLPSLFLWIIIGYVIIHVLVHIILQIHSWHLTNQKKSENIPMNSMGSDERSTVEDNGEYFKQMVLGFYVVMVSLFALVMVLIIAFAPYT